MDQISVSFDGMTFVIRPNTWDQNVLRDVILLDEYGLKNWREVGIKPKLIVDIGGHIGSFVAAAHRVWPDASILSFEAYQPNYDLLVRNIAQFPNTRAVHGAVVGDDSLTEVKFATSPQNTGGGGVHPNGNIVVPACGVSRLLHLIEPNRIDMLKLDCEGGEADILAGLERLGRLSEIEAVFGEWHGIERRNAVKGLLERTHGVKLLPDPLPPGVDLGQFCALRR